MRQKEKFNPEEAAGKLYPDNIAKAVMLEVSKIFEEVHRQRFESLLLHGRSPSGILGGLLFLLGIRHKRPLKVRSLAWVLQVTEETIQNSYKFWLKKFPDLFPEFKYVKKTGQWILQFLGEDVRVITKNLGEPIPWEDEEVRIYVNLEQQIRELWESRGLEVEEKTIHPLGAGRFMWTIIAKQRDWIG